MVITLNSRFCSLFGRCGSVAVLADSLIFKPLDAQFIPGSIGFFFSVSGSMARTRTVVGCLLLTPAENRSGQTRNGLAERRKSRSGRSARIVVGRRIDWALSTSRIHQVRQFESSRNSRMDATPMSQPILGKYGLKCNHWGCGPDLKQVTRFFTVVS